MNKPVIDYAYNLSGEDDGGPDKYPVYVMIVKENNKSNSMCYFTVYTNRTNATDDIKLFTSKDKPKPFVVTVRTKAEWLELKKKHNPFSVGYHIVSNPQRTNRRKPN